MGWSKRHWFVGLGIFAVGCGAVKNDAATVAADEVTTVRSALTFNTTIFAPLGWNPTESAVSGLATVRVNDRAIVRDFATLLPAPVNNLGSVETNIGVDARIGTLLSAAPTTLRDRAIVNGSLYTTTTAVRQNGVVVALFDRENLGGVPLDRSWSRAITWPTIVQPGQTLEPGQSPPNVGLQGGLAYQFAVAKSGRGFILTGPGEYFFDYMTIEPGGRLVINAGAGPVTVHLKQSFTFRGTMSGVSTPGLPIPSFTVIAQGSGLNSIEQSFNGVLVAPSGSISVAGGRTIRGALQGGVVEVHQNAVIEHVRDTHYLDRFEASGVGRAQVTGGSMRRNTEVTDEYLQSEAVTAITITGSNPATVVVGYNDKTEPTVAPKAVYSPDRNGDRTLHKGVSQMGWSYSTDGGRTFTYGGRVTPPSGWSVIWSDPSMAKASIADPFVYYAMAAGSTSAFEATPDNNNDRETIFNSLPLLDGWCVARSKDRGITFPDVACPQIPPGFGTADGTTIAVGMNAGRRQVYVTGVGPTTGNGNFIWRLDGDATPMTITPLPNVQIGSANCVSHPRLRVVNGQGGFGGLLYIVCQNELNQIVGNTFNIATSTWQTPRIIAAAADPGFGFASMTLATSVSFDVGANLSGDPKVRVMYAIDEGGAGGKAMATVECQPDLTGCFEVPGWGTRGMVGWEGAPSMRYQGFGRWAASFMTETNDRRVGMNVGFLATEPPNASGGTPVLKVRVASPPVFPCVLLGQKLYWGDYNEIDTYGQFGVFVPFTVNGPSACRYQSEFNADQHVGGASVLTID